MEHELFLMKQQLLQELEHVLSIWEQRSWDDRRKIWRTMGCDNQPLESGERSGVLIARVLWAYSAAKNLTGRARYGMLAQRAYDDLCGAYLDEEYGGIYHRLAADGTVLDEHKVTYDQSYAIYALSEYYRATGDEQALSRAMTLFALVERGAWDEQRGGYHSACDRSWRVREGNFTMDTHLHLMEAYTNLHKARADERVRESLRRTVEVLQQRFLRHNGALYQLLQPDWQPTEDRSDRFGDEGEGVWMMCEAADQIGDERFSLITRQAVQLMADNILTRGMDPEHGGVYDRLNTDGSMSTDKLWWEESECVIAMLYAWERFGDVRFARAAMNIWSFMGLHFLNAYDEWNWKTRADGSFIPITDPSSPLKCPYHSARITVLGVPVLERVLGK